MPSSAEPALFLIELRPWTPAQAACRSATRQRLQLAPKRTSLRVRTGAVYIWSRSSVPYFGSPRVEHAPGLLRLRRKLLQE